MSNQAILWSMLILPWLTLFLMKKEDIKRFMPVALFTAVTQAIIVEVGITLGFLGGGRETLFPLNQMPTFTYGAISVFTMWIFKFTYERFGLYIAVNAIIDYGFAYIISYSQILFDKDDMNAVLVCRHLAGDHCIVATNPFR